MISVIRSGLAGITQEISVISNNIANANTNAFKRSRSEFVDFYSKALSSSPKSKAGLGTILQGTQKVMKQGSPILTGSALDLTISGKGFFILSPKVLEHINGDQYNYNTDGMIFTSKYDNVPINGRKVTWEKSFKWKPPEYNTIDFLIQIKKDTKGEKIDVVVFAAPQLSIIEMAELAELCAGKHRANTTDVIVCTSSQVYGDAVSMGYVEKIESFGGQVLVGTCFYQQYAREIGLANGWKRLLSNSTKIVNILGGYGYKPCLATMAECIASAEKGIVVK